MGTSVTAESPTEILERKKYEAELEDLDAEEISWIRRMVIEFDRLDILCELVLGYEIKPFHRSLQVFQVKRARRKRKRRSLQLAFRGSGKTTSCTVARCILEIIKNPNVRILIASKTGGAGSDMLKEIKFQFEGNERLRLIFGDFVGKKWDTNRIEVKGRTIAAKEPTIMTLGIESQVVSKHFDLIICDDLVDEENSRTKYMRERTKTFFYKTLLPTLEPDGEIHILGTRYHYSDLYGHLIENEYAEDWQRIMALKEDPPGSGNYKTPWPERFTVEHFLELKSTMGTIIFNSQYQCDTEAMKGEIFDYDWMEECSLSEVPSTARKYMGVDLAIKESEQADCFAIVVIAVEGFKIWVIDYYEGHLSFGKQVDKVIEYDKRYGPARVGIEVNAYQAALAQEVKIKNSDVPVRRINTDKDKVTRAHRLAGRFENGDVRFVSGNSHVIEHLVLFPGGDTKDLFDAFDLAVKASKKRRGRRPGRKTEPGLI